MKFEAIYESVLIETNSFQVLSHTTDGAIRILSNTGTRYEYTGAVPSIARKLLQFVHQKRWGEGWQLLKSLKLISKGRIKEEQDFDSVFKPMPMEEFIKNLTSQKGWTQNKDGSWDVVGYVNLIGMNLKKLPLRFGKVSGYFSCNHNKLTTLEGAPKEVGGYFSCSGNNLISLQGGPKKVGEGFYCYNNQLTTLEGGPEYVGGIYFASDNQLTTLQGAPKHVGRDWYLHDNPVSEEELLKTLHKEQ